MRKENFTMLSKSLVLSLFCCFLIVNGNVFEKKYDEEEGRIYLNKINADIQVKTTESVLASWAYESNITDENLKHQLDVSAKLANYTKEIWKETIKYPWTTFKDPDVRRQFQKFSVLGTAILSPPKYQRFNKIISDMQSVYGKAKICNYFNRSDCSLQLEPELTEIFVKSKDPDELRYYWEEWRNEAGKPVREMYKEYVELSNEAAILNNFTNNAEFWLKDYEAKDFKEQVEVLWQQLRPLYLQLHAFVRRRLREQYGEKHVSRRGPIPAHLLGNMWAQSWGNLFDFTAPYPGKPSMDVTPNMVSQGYTPLRMFKLAEEFFTSLNLSPMPDTFWRNSILEKPNDGRDLICHASAWDFYDGKDFRIKQCTRITMEDLNTVHHEMGHIQYFLQYKNQPLVYREGTNPGFHEAVGDVMALSVSTPKHLRKIGLLNATEDDAESEINQLYSMALDKIAFLPFGYLMDQWRWSVFEGTTTEQNYNCKWWQLREKYQGLSPSVMRSENDFDPGAKYHTVGNVPYIRYFVSFVIQFQFHRSLCIAAKEYDPNDAISKPLHKCDIYQSGEAGALLKKMLQMGSSKPWPDAMEVLTNQRKMDASALLEYFATLQDWLEKENARTGEYIGWEPSRMECAVEEDVEAMKPSSTQGNFEDDNIAYSYAEFVRQDDNSFGFPDYLEEIQPSYQALAHRSKESEFRANYFLPKRNSRRHYSNPYQPEGSYIQYRNKFVDKSKMALTKKRSESEPLKPTEGAHARPKLKTDTSSKTNRYRQTSTEEQTSDTPLVDKEMKLLNALLKNVQYMNSMKSNQEMPKEQPYIPWFTRRDVTNEKAASKVEETKNEAKDAEEKKAKIDEDRQKDANALSKEKMNEIDLKDAGQNSGLKGNEEPIDSNLQLEIEKGRADNALVESHKKSTKFIPKNFESLKSPEDLLWKAEMIKNEAEKMLRSLNFSYSPTASYISELPFDDEYLNQEAETSKNVTESTAKARSILPRYSTRDYFKSGVNINLKSLENFLNNAGYAPMENGEKSKNRLNLKDYDLVLLTPTDGGTKEKNEEKRQVPVGNGELVYLFLARKSPQKRSSMRREKKSYKEYRILGKTPVIYNAVVISPGEKNEKPDGSIMSSKNETTYSEGFSTNGGAGMNVTFFLILMAMFLHAYTSQWFQKIDFHHYKAKWMAFRNLFYSRGMCNPLKNFEKELEAAIFEANWTVFKKVA